MKKITTFEEHLDKQYGKKGSEQRDKFESDSISFRLGEMLREERMKAKLTQEQLAEKTGTKKSYISRIEAGKSDIQISTFYRIIELGLRKRLTISIT
ncbi:MAG: transcriptional regulator [Ignavibacteriales bacterium CG_4_9_14_3_um_filter_34_10]|nr:MAG: transcriptional regulator [Ignavibacteriales bacterium CG_4_9_14_3_um_filter_34_10]